MDGVKRVLSGNQNAGRLRKKYAGRVVLLPRLLKWQRCSGKVQQLSSVIVSTKYDFSTVSWRVSCLSPAKVNRDGNHDIKIGFAEPRSDGDSNAKIANILEYGKSGQPAKPFLKPAKTASRSAAINAMQEKLEEEVKRR
jgi:hypothetical protein